MYQRLAGRAGGRAELMAQSLTIRRSDLRQTSESRAIMIVLLLMFHQILRDKKSPEMADFLATDG